MKYIIILILISTTASAQNYADSTITIQAPRCFAWWVTKSIEGQLTRQNFRMVDALKPYLADTTKPDSLFTVKIPAKYVQSALELLATRPLSLAFDDYIKIIYNKKIGATGNAIAGYTALENQIVTKANGSNGEKQVAIYLRDWFVNRKQDFINLYREERNNVVELIKQ